MAKSSSGLFLVLEGGEGSGKTALAKDLDARLDQSGYRTFLTKEPGGASGICARVRELLLDPSCKGAMSFRAEFLLFEADRAQHVNQVIAPALEEGKIVVCDRFEAATFAYQCAARGVCTPAEFKKINGFATGGLKPHFTFWLDLDPRIGLQRNADAGKRDRFELEDIAFHDRVRVGYRQYFEMLSKDRWQKFDGKLPLEKLAEQIWETVKRLL